MKKIMNLLIDGEANMKDIEDAVDKWHKESNSMSLPEYLGMSDAEFSIYVKNEDLFKELFVDDNEEKKKLLQSDIDSLKSILDKLSQAGKENPRLDQKSFIFAAEKIDSEIKSIQSCLDTLNGVA